MTRRRLDELTGGIGGKAAPPAPADAWQPILPVPADAPAELPRHREYDAPACRWAYRSSAGELLGYVVRWDRPDGKKILPATFCEGPTGARQWRWKQFPSPRPLYGLDRLAARPDAMVLIVEGEKAADAGAALFPEMVVVTSPGGSKAAGKADWSPLAGRDVRIWPDNDEAGGSYGKTVAALATKAGAASVHIVAVPSGWPEAWDLADPPPEGVTPDALRAMLNAPAAPPAAATSAATKPPGRGRGREPGIREQLIDLGDGYEFWHDADGEAYATIPVVVGGRRHYENHALESAAFRRRLSIDYGRAYPRTRQDGGTAPAGVPSAVLREAIETLSGRAAEGPEHTPVVRGGGDTEAIYVDLGCSRWLAVRITAEGWEVIDNPPVKFIRHVGHRALPVPERGGALKELRSFVNVASDADFAIVCATPIAAMMPNGPFPILVVIGEQGAAKDTLLHALRRMIDPNKAMISSPPASEEDLVLDAKSSLVVAVGNVSHLTPEQADWFCRLATGAGKKRRRLNTHELWIGEAKRLVMLNGIPHPTMRSDFTDRSWTVELPRIDKSQRKTERKFWADYEAKLPRLTGALYDALSMALRRLPEMETELPWRPRMGDATEWVCAAAPALGLTGRQMLDLLEGNVKGTVAQNLEGSLLVAPLQDLIAAPECQSRLLAHGHWWKGTASELLEALGGLADEKTTRRKGWPGDARSLSNHLKRLAPDLRQLGIDVTKEREAGTGARHIIIRPPPDPIAADAPAAPSGEDRIPI